MAATYSVIALLALSLCRILTATSADTPLAVQFADWILATWPDPTTLTNKGWEYNNGIILHGIAKVHEKNGDPRYLDYIKRFVDAYLTEEGTVALRPEHNLDTIQPGVLLLFLYERTGEEKYRRGADYVRAAFDRFPKNSEGGFWHKNRYPDEMWVDGIYMTAPFLVKYGRLFETRSDCFDIALFQTTLCARHTQDPATGLLRHAWDSDRNAAWAEPQTGVSPEVWSRGMGWFAMALVDMLEYLPAHHPGRSGLIEMFRKVAAGVKQTQDPVTGLWYQVMDKGGLADNWHETSGSGMFVYALKVGIDRNYLPGEYQEVVTKAWQGLKSKVTYRPDGSPVISDAVEGMGVQDSYDGYINKKRVQNSAHALCAILMASTAVEMTAPQQQHAKR
ncbi:MAG TPA: glycoside hydrolase family 88 protein [Acidobacteriota bacterium]|nr:glycoside hydrolase family 88 protein [Acidobacteriota bacterium]